MKDLTSLPVLLIEDEESDIFMARRAFIKANLKNPIHIVRSGEDAVDYFSGKGPYTENAPSPRAGLILLDLKLPRMKGQDFLRWFRSHPDWAEIPVVVLTSSLDPEDERRAYDHGADSYMLKPMDAHELAEVFAALAEGEQCLHHRVRQ